MRAGASSCTVHRARILNPDAVREAITGKLTNLLREKERDYLNKEEQKLIPNLAFYHSRGTGLIHLEGRDGFTLLQSIVATKRAYLDLIRKATDWPQRGAKGARKT